MDNMKTKKSDGTQEDVAVSIQKQNLNIPVTEGNSEASVDVDDKISSTISHNFWGDRMGISATLDSDGQVEAGGRFVVSNSDTRLVEGGGSASLHTGEEGPNAGIDLNTRLHNSEADGSFTDFSVGSTMAAGVNNNGIDVKLGGKVEAKKHIQGGSGGSLTLTGGADAKFGTQNSVGLHGSVEGITAPSLRAVIKDGKLQIISTQYLGKAEWNPTKDIASVNLNPEHQSLYYMKTGIEHKLEGEKEAYALKVKGFGGEYVNNGQGHELYLEGLGAKLGGGYKEADVTYEARTLSSGELKAILQNTIRNLETEKKYLETQPQNAASPIQAGSYLNAEYAKIRTEQIEKEIDELKHFDNLELKYLKENLITHGELMHFDIAPVSLENFLIPEEYYKTEKVYSDIITGDTINHTLTDEIKLASALKKTFDGEGFEKIREHAIQRGQEEGMSKDEAEKYIDEEINNNINSINDQLKKQFIVSAIYNGDYQTAIDGLSADDYENLLVELNEKDPGNSKIETGLSYLYGDWNPENTHEQIGQMVTEQLGNGASEDPSTWDLRNYEDNEDNENNEFPADDLTYQNPQEDFAYSLPAQPSDIVDELPYDFDYTPPYSLDANEQGMEETPDNGSSDDTPSSDNESSTNESPSSDNGSSDDTPSSDNDSSYVVSSSDNDSSYVSPSSDSGSSDSSPSSDSGSSDSSSSSDSGSSDNSSSSDSGSSDSSSSSDSGSSDDSSGAEG